MGYVIALKEIQFLVLSFDGIWPTKPQLLPCQVPLANMPPEDPNAKVRWTFAGPIAEGRQPAGKGLSTNLTPVIRPRLLGQARADLTRVKSAKKTGALCL